eukprot:1584979-Amphidinium_carterae.1
MSSIQQAKSASKRGMDTSLATRLVVMVVRSQEVPSLVRNWSDPCHCTATWPCEQARPRLTTL